MSLPVRIVIAFALQTILVWALSTFAPDSFFVGGGVKAFAIIGALITLLNMFVRPILTILTLPFRLFATLIAIIIVNGAILWLVREVSFHIDPSILTFEIAGGIGGWVTASIVFGFGEWIVRLFSAK
jgi:uncharacterized membrane protein YvlD (DUF360 family)